MAKVYFRGTRQEARAIVRGMAATLTGLGTANRDLAEGVHTSVGLAALSDIHEAFIVKSRGGTGEDGIKWAPLKPATLAYGRKAPRGLGFAPGGKDGLLTKAQLKRWRQIYGTRLARFALSMPMGSAKARAAQVAWAQIKREGGRTKIAEYANRPHEIGRDTGVMLNSLSPGEVTNDQVLRTISNGVIVGTSVPYAGPFHKYRPLWPKKTPGVWMERWVNVARDAASVAFRIAITRGVTQ